MTDIEKLEAALEPYESIENKETKMTSKIIIPCDVGDAVLELIHAGYNQDGFHITLNAPGDRRIILSWWNDSAYPNAGCGTFDGDFTLREDK